MLGKYKFRKGQRVRPSAAGIAPVRAERTCRAYKTVPRSPELPAEVRLIEIICPDCDDGDFHSERWFSAPGVEVSQNREAH